MYEKGLIIMDIHWGLTAIFFSVQLEKANAEIQGVCKKID